MVEPANPLDEPLHAHAEAGVRNRALLAQIEIPVESLFRQMVFLDALPEQVVIGHSLAAADNLAITLGREHVHAGAERFPDLPRF